jgi:heme exporter protein D
MVKALLALIPSVGVLFLFVIVVKAMLEGDRRERAAQARLEREQDERARRSAGTD